MASQTRARVLLFHSTNKKLLNHEHVCNSDPPQQQCESNQDAGKPEREADEGISLAAEEVKGGDGDHDQPAGEQNGNECPPRLQAVAEAGNFARRARGVVGLVKEDGDVGGWDDDRVVVINRRGVDGDRLPGRLSGPGRGGGRWRRGTCGGSCP